MTAKFDNDNDNSMRVLALSHTTRRVPKLQLTPQTYK